MSGDLISVQLEIKNREVRREIEKILSATAGFRAADSDIEKGCDLLILEIGEDLKKEFHLIRSLQSAGSVKAIFLTSPHVEPDILIEALRAGAKEFFSQPIKGEEVRNSLAKFKENWKGPEAVQEPKKKGKIINVIGSKGGVGVTTIAVNLAAGLAEQDKSRSVALVDMNLNFGEVPIFLDIKSPADWGEVVKNISRVDATLLRSILFKHPSRISVLASPARLDGENRVTPEILEKLLEAMQETFDFTVVDGGQGLDDLSLKIIEMAHRNLVVANLSLPCLTNSKRLLWTFQRLGFSGTDKIRIIINNRYQKNSLISLKEAEQSLNYKIFWQIPNDFKTTMAAINQGKIISQVGAGAEISKNFRELAASMVEKGQMGKEPGKERVGFWGKLTH